MKTIRQIWDETPQGLAITDAGYLDICSLLESKFRLSLTEFAQTWPAIWNCKNDEAKNFILAKSKEKDKADALNIADEERNLNRPLNAIERERVVFQDYYARLDAFMGIDSRKRF